jgi:hypothetical protein
MTHKGLLALGTLAILVAAPAYSGNAIDDACPDEGGSAYIVDTAAEALTVANDYHRPDCRLIIRTSLDRSSITDSTLRVTAKSITIEGPLEITHPLVDSRIVLTAVAGDVVISNARLSARKEVWIECRSPATCTVSVHKSAQVNAARAIRILSRGSSAVEDAKLLSAELDVQRGVARP